MSVIWGSMEGDVIWAGVDEECDRRGKEGIAILVPPKVWRGVEG